VSREAPPYAAFTTWVGPDWPASLVEGALRACRRRLGRVDEVEMRVQILGPGEDEDMPGGQIAVTMVGWKAGQARIRERPTGEWRCPDCYVERADWDPGGGWLGRCPNCGATTYPLRTEEMADERTRT
jgi:hypothetical protein